MSIEGGRGSNFQHSMDTHFMHDWYSLLYASHSKWSTGKMQIMDTITIQQIKNFKCKTTLPHLENSLSSAWKNEYVENYPSQWCFRFTFFYVFESTSPQQFKIETIYLSKSLRLAKTLNTLKVHAKLCLLIEIRVGKFVTLKTKHTHTWIIKTRYFPLK